jgi:hypothetical protein
MDNMSKLVKLKDVPVGRMVHIPNIGNVKRLKDKRLENGRMYQQIEWNGKAMTIYTKQLVERL